MHFSALMEFTYLFSLMKLDCANGMRLNPTRHKSSKPLPETRNYPNDSHQTQVLRDFIGQPSSIIMSRLAEALKL